LKHLTISTLEVERALWLEIGLRREPSEISLVSEGKFIVKSHFLFSRTIVKSHIPKKHLDFDNPPKTGGPTDNTTERIYGELKPQPMVAQSGVVGSGYNPADDLPKVGRKTQNMEREVSHYPLLNFLFRSLLKLPRRSK